MRREISLCVGQAIRRRRLSLGLTQQEVAERVRSKRPLVCRAESALHVLTLSTLERYAEALDCKLSELITDAEALAEQWPEVAP
jgi:transcriptional regulator with XRE-family HTH domain